MKHLKITSKITTRDSYSIDRYLSEISKLPLLSDNEEIELAQLVKGEVQMLLIELLQPIYALWYP